MTRGMNARIAGFTLLFYIGAGVTELVLRGAGHSADGIAVRLARMGQQASALVLAVTLYRITRDEGPVLAIVAMICRMLEGVGSTIASLLQVRWNQNAIFFAVGSTLFAYLFLRGRMIPAALAWLGFLASVSLVVILPLQLAGLFGGRSNWFGAVTWLMWLPMLVFEVTLALWLIVKGVAMPVRRQTT
jgi:hypothetical protein